MSNRLIRSMAVVVLSMAPLSIALSAAPAHAASHPSTAPSASVPSHAATCSIKGVVAVSQPLTNSTKVTVDAVCSTSGVAGVTIKVNGVAVVRTQLLYTANVSGRVQVVIPSALPVGTEVCAELGGAEACAHVQM